MKISLLPKFNMEPTKEEREYSFPPLYTGNSKTAAKVFSLSFYFISFLIPLCAFLFFMHHFSYAPFGEKCLFVTDGAFINLPALNSVIHDIQNGSFHFFTISGTQGSELFTTIYYYLMSPTTLFCLFFEQETAVSLMSVFCIIKIALSAPIFLYYLTHRHIGKRAHIADPMPLVFSLAYAMSNYALVQYNEFMFLDHFMLFPLLILFLEELIYNKKSKNLLLLNTFLFFSNFYMALVLDFFLALYVFLRSEKDILDTLSDFCKFVRTLILSALFSAVTVIPGLYKYFTTCTTAAVSINPNLITDDAFSFFLRHLFYQSPSFSDTGIAGLNVYAGVFSILLLFLYFVTKEISVKTRIKGGAMILVLILALCTEQLNCFFHLFTQISSAFTMFTFVYIFLVLSLSFDSTVYLRFTSLKRILLASIIPFACILFSMNYTKIKPNYTAIYYTMALLLVYIILLLLYRIGSIGRDAFQSMILCICILELLANAFQLSVHISKENTLLDDVIISECDTLEYEEFMRAEMIDHPEFSYRMGLNSRSGLNPLVSPQTNPVSAMPLSDSMFRIRYVFEENTKEKSVLIPSQYERIGEDEFYHIYENKMVFPATFFVTGRLDEKDIVNHTEITKQNSIAKALGASENIYEEIFPENVTITTDEKSNLNVHNLGHNVFIYPRSKELTSQNNITSTIHFTPRESGSLCLSIQGRCIYFGEVSANTSYEYDFNHSIAEEYDNAYWIQFFLINSDALSSLSSKLNAQKCSLSKDGAFGLNLVVNCDTASTVLTNLAYSDSFYFSGNSNKEYELFPYRGQLAIYVPAGQHNITIQYHYFPATLGLCVSLLSILCMLIPLLIKQVNSALSSLAIKSETALRFFFERLLHHMSENKIYYFAFFIPFTVWLLLMIALQCDPFGPYGIFDGDGISIAIPTHMQMANIIKEGLSTAHSWYGGGGYNVTDFIQLTPAEFIYYFIPQEHIATFLAFLYVVLTSLSAPCVVFYFTHRLYGKRASKKDFRLLVPALCYSSCQYMIFMLNNFTWYYAFLLFPLIILGMDYLMIKGKKRYYIATLGLSLLTQYYMTMFICFFLVIRFFTYRFNNIRDFIKKGIRFAVCSISTAFLSFSTLFFALSAISDNSYRSDDSVFPSFYWFTGFDSLLRRFSLFCVGHQISWDEGEANLYCGILTLLLFVLYLFIKEISFKDKLRLLIPYLILFVTLNNSVMNYLFNGMHYQNGVPNRFAFLLPMLVAFISYDCLCHLQSISRKKVFVGSSLIAIMFVVLYVQKPDDVVTLTALIATLIFLLIYCIVLYIPYKKKKRLGETLLVSFFCVEIVANLIYQIPLITSSTYFIKYLDSPIDYINEDLEMENSLDHIAVYSSFCEDYPMVSNAKSEALFTTSLTPWHAQFGNYLGYSGSANCIIVRNSLTPIGNALGNNRYFLMNSLTQPIFACDSWYNKPFAQIDNTILFENEHYVPFAYYLPKSASELMDQVVEVNALWNYLSYAFLGLDNTYVIVEHLSYKNNEEFETATEQNVYTYYPDMNNPRDDKHHFRLTAPDTGSVYVKISDFQYLGEYEKGETIDFTMDSRYLLATEADFDAYVIATNNDLIPSLCEEISKHSLEIESFTDDTIKGSIDMPEDGYINFTMPYDDKWTVFIDGQETKSCSLGNGFFTVEVPKGTHDVYLEYNDNRRLPAFLITGLGWLGFLAICFLSDKRKKKS